MDTKLTCYRQLLQRIFLEYADLLNRHPKPEQETEVVFDETRDHYILHTIGWDGKQRIWNTPLYVRLRNGKIWVEIDWMEEGIVEKLYNGPKNLDSENGKNKVLSEPCANTIVPPSRPKWSKRSSKRRRP